MDEHLVKVWNVDLVDGRKVKVATLEQGPRKLNPMCKGCYALCCRGTVRPVLNAEEFTTKKFPHRFQPLPFFLGVQGVKADYLATLDTPENTNCRYFDSEKLRCTIFPKCPASCLAYDCREEFRSEMKPFMKKRRKEWKKNRGRY